MEADWISAIVSVIALVSSGVAYISTRKTRQRTALLEEKSAELAELQNRFSHQSWVDEYFRDLTQWAGELAYEIARGIHCFDVGDEALRRDILTQLSVRIDTGRWYFPNQLEDGLGEEKEPAYRGRRQPLLDWAVLAYDIYAGNRQAAEPKSVLLKCQRNFVSAIQEHIDPRAREDSIRKILLDFGPVGSMPKVTSPKNED